MTRFRVAALILVLSGAVCPAGSAGPARGEEDESALAEKREIEAERQEDEAEDARRRERRNLDPKDVAKGVEFLKQFRPHIAARLGEIQEENPERYREEIRRAFFEARELDEIKKHAPAEHAEMLRMMRYRARPYRLAADYFIAPTSRKGQIRKQLVATLNEIFEQRQLELKAELRELEEHIAELRNEVSGFRANKAGLIEERLAELKGDGASGAVFW